MKRFFYLLICLSIIYGVNVYAQDSKPDNPRPNNNYSENTPNSESTSPSVDKVESEVNNNNQNQSEKGWFESFFDKVFRGGGGNNSGNRRWIGMVITVVIAIGVYIFNRKRMRRR